MQIRKVPTGLSNTKLKSCDEILKKVEKNGFKVEIRPRIIYQKLGEDTIFTNFADSNQALRKQLRPRFLTKDEKLPKEDELRDRLNSLENKISYKTPTDNNLLKYLSNLLLYKAFILDVMDQITTIKRENIKLEAEQKKKLDEKKGEINKLNKNIEEKKQKIESEKENIKTYKEAKANTEEDLQECKKQVDDKKVDQKSLQSRICEDENNIEKYKKALKKAETNNKLISEKLKQDYIDRNKRQRELEELDGYKEYEKLKDLDSFFTDCEKLDYKVSVHIRFTRTMNALNAYAPEKFTLENIKNHRKPYHETGIADEFGRMMIKRKNLMKLERHKINRYVMWQGGGLYTTVFSDTSLRPYERTKFKYAKSSSVRDMKQPVWNYNDHNEDGYTVQQRIKDSCDNFNKLIENNVVSTYANYYGVNNVLEVAKVENERSKSYLEYEYENTKRGLSIPIYMKSQPVTTTKAPLHVPIKNKMPSKIDKFSYVPLEIIDRPASIDIHGLLYAIREGKIAVSWNSKKAGFHSTMWSGKAVQAAGILCAWNGKIIAVDNASGHYRPNWHLLYSAWEPFYGKGVFHDLGMLGICVAIDRNNATQFGRAEGFYVAQFFKAKKFMEFAKKRFEIGQTVNELENHLNKLSDIGTFNVIEQNRNDCSDVFNSPHMKSYHDIWGNKKKREALACEFIMSMEYDWEEVIDKVKVSYRDFPAKGGKLFSWLFLKKIENIFKKRTKKLKEHGINEYEKIRDKLKDATAAYKEVVSKILKKCPSKEDLKNLKNKSQKNQRIKKDIGSAYLYELIKCISVIDAANGAYSKCKNVLDEKEQKKIESWSKSVKSALKCMADKEAGLLTKEEINGTREKGDIFLDEEKQKKEIAKLVEEERKKPVNQRMKDIDDLDNYVLSAEDKRTDKTKLPLVDKRIYEPPPKKTQSTTAKEGVLLYCVRCEGDFDPTGWRPPGEPKLAVGSNCPNCKGYNPLKKKNL